VKFPWHRRIRILSVLDHVAPNIRLGRGGNLCPVNPAGATSDFV